MHRRLAGALAGAWVVAFLAGCAPEATTDGAPQSQTGNDVLLDPAESPEEADRDAGTFPAESPAEPDREEPSAETPDADASAPAAPAALSIPSIEVHEEVIELGLSPDGTLEDPSDWDDVGWFAPGGSPGGAAPTVFAGHVDSTTGPAVFYRLLELRPGDEVEVTDAEGQVHTYRVDRIEDHPKDDFPTHEVFGPVSENEVRLITCTGEFDHDALRHLDNRVVYASTVE